MLYGFEDREKNRPITVVVAADTLEELNAWATDELNSEEQHFTEERTPNLMESMTNNMLQGYQAGQIKIVTHQNKKQKEDFQDQWGIKILKSAKALDKHLDMIHEHKSRIEAEKAKTEEIDTGEVDDDGNPITVARSRQTIEQIYGLDKHDPWDRRSPEEIEAAKKRKIEAGKAQTQGGNEVTGQSFDPTVDDDYDTGLHTTGIRSTGHGVSVVATKGMSGASASPSAKVVPQEVKDETNSRKLMEQYQPVFLPAKCSLTSKELHDWVKDNAKSWGYEINPGVWVFNYPEDATDFEDHVNRAHEASASGNSQDASENDDTTVVERDAIPPEMRKVLKQQIIDDEGVSDEEAEALLDHMERAGPRVKNSGLGNKMMSSKNPKDFLEGMKELMDTIQFPAMPDKEEDLPDITLDSLDRADGKVTHDPMKKFREAMSSGGELSPEDTDDIFKAISKQIAGSLSGATKPDGTVTSDPSEMADAVYRSMTPTGIRKAMKEEIIEGLKRGKLEEQQKEFVRIFDDLDDEDAQGLYEQMKQLISDIDESIAKGEYFDNDDGDATTNPSFTSDDNSEEGNDKKQKPVASDYRFCFNQENTDNPALGGEDIPVFNLASNPDGPSGGKWNTMYAEKFFPKGFVSISGPEVFCYEGKLSLGEAMQSLIDAGFVNDPNLVAEIAKKRRENKEAERAAKKGKGGNKAKLTPDMFRDYFGGDGTTTIAGLNSHGRHSIGHTDDDRETKVNIDNAPVMDIYSALRSTTLEALGREKEDEDNEDSQNLGSILRTMFGSDLAGKPLKYGDYYGLIQPGSRVMIPEMPGKTEVINGWNVTHCGVTKFGDLNVHTFVRDKSTYYGVIMVRHFTEKDIPVKGTDQTVKAKVEEICIIRIQ